MVVAAVGQYVRLPVVAPNDGYRPTLVQPLNERKARAVEGRKFLASSLPQLPAPVGHVPYQPY